MTQVKGRSRLSAAAPWAGCLLAVLLALSWGAPDKARQAAAADTVTVARRGVLEHVWEAEFHVGWSGPGQAQALLTAALPAARLQRLHPGDEVTVMLQTGEGERKMAAKVVDVSPPVDGVAHALLTAGGVEGLADAPARMPGQIVLADGPFGTIVPVTSLHRRDGTDGVFVERRGGPAWVPVRVIARTLTEALVEGVAPGTKLVDAAAP